MNTLSTRQLYQSHRFFLRHSFSAAASPSSVALPSPSLSHLQRRSDEESRAVRVSVWWDFENCSLPAGVNVFKVAHCITSAVRVSGIKGPVQITAFGDIFQLAKSNQEALSATGITLKHVPSGGKNSADRSLLLDLMYWVSNNPPPAHLFLITGDRDFSGILHRLRMSNYNILLACPDDRTSSVLCSAASIMWHWSPLVKGESFACKYLNQPPDGPYNSWYGHYKGALQDPFAVAAPKLPASSNTEDTSDSGLVCESEPVGEQRLRPVPRDVFKKLRRIVNSQPKGIPLTLLQGRMLSGAVRMDRNFYGHKSFFQLLLSKPNLVSINQSKGHFVVFPAYLAASEQKVEAKSGEAEKAEAISDCENPDLAASSVSKAHADSDTETLNEKKSDTVSEKREIYAEGKEVSKSSAENRDSEDETGYFGKLWTKWFKKNDTGSEEKTDRTLGDDKLTMDAKVDSTTVAQGDKSKGSTSPGLCTKLFGWFKLSGKDADAIADESIEKSKQMESKRDELFLMDSFWSDVESFLHTDRGSKIIWNSKTREEIAENLRKEGPSVIQPLSENNLLHLIDLLISEKKWIKELPQSPSPFRVVKVVKAKFPFETTTKPCWKTKDEVLADCKKLLEEMFMANPEAVNVGLFKVKFFEKYGYEVDYRKLGYPKLASLIQTLPDTRVELNQVYSTVPKEITPSDIEDKPEKPGVGQSKDDEKDSSWEELGPVADKSESPVSDGKRAVDFDSKLKLGKRYSFVVDDVGKEGLMEGILNKLKKSGNQKMGNTEMK